MTGEQKMTRIGQMLDTVKYLVEKKYLLNEREIRLRNPYIGRDYSRKMIIYLKNVTYLNCVSKTRSN